MNDYAAQNESAPRRRRSGCLRGCLVVVIVLLLAVGGTIGYVAWNIYAAFQNEPRLQAILQSVHNDARAQAVLGEHYAMMEVEHRSFPMNTGDAFAETYRLVIIGGTGKSFLDVRLEPGRGGMKLVSMVLTAPDGRQVTLKASQR